MCCVARTRRIDTCDGPDLLEPGKHIGRRQTHGIAGALAFIFISLRDSAFMLPIIASVCCERLDHHQLHLLDVRDDIALGLRYHKLLFEEIAHQLTPGLGVIVHDLDRLRAAHLVAEPDALHAHQRQFGLTRVERGGSAD